MTTLHPPFCSRSCRTFKALVEDFKCRHHVRSNFPKFFMLRKIECQTWASMELSLFSKPKQTEIEHIAVLYLSVAGLENIDDQDRNPNVDDSVCTHLDKNIWSGNKLFFVCISQPSYIFTEFLSLRSDCMPVTVAEQTCFSWFLWLALLRYFFLVESK